MAAEEKKAEPTDAEKPAKEKIHVGDWLLLGPLPCPLAAYDDEGDSKKGAEELLGYEQLPLKGLTPVAGSKVKHIAGRKHYLEILA